jgi:hypothetical protein
VEEGGFCLSPENRVRIARGAPGVGEKLRGHFEFFPFGSVA